MSREFEINASIRRGCVLNPWCCNQQGGVGAVMWRPPSFGFDFGDGGPRLLDIRFADDISSFCNFAEEIRIIEQ